MDLSNLADGNHHRLSISLENPCRPPAAAGFPLAEWFQCAQGSGLGPQLRALDRDLPESVEHS